MPRTWQKDWERWTRGMLVVATVLAAVVLANTVQAQTPASVPELTRKEAADAILYVRKTWRAQDGSTVDEILTRTAKVAHFILRGGWQSNRDQDGSINVGVGWVKRKTDEDDETIGMGWVIQKDGSMSLGPNYARVMELGWQAFALSMIQDELTNEERGANVKFLHDTRNLNFIHLEPGNLGDLLSKGRCSLEGPVHVGYTDVSRGTPQRKGDFWIVQLSVNCDIPGPEYFTHEGVVIFQKEGVDAWKPSSLFAQRIAGRHPGAWFD